MKKITAIILTALLLLFAAACGNNDQPSSSPAEESTAPETSTEEESTEPSTEAPVEGTVHDFGRLSVLIPEGWEIVDLGGLQEENNAMIVKGKAEDFMTASSASILYFLPEEMFISSRGFYENSHNEGEFDLGGHHWEAWSAKTEEMSVICAESLDMDTGSIVFTLSMPAESDVVLSLEDPDVRAMLESIVVVPTVEVDWITLKDGVAYANLPEVEGFTWASGGVWYTNDLDAEDDWDGSTLIITPLSGSGVYSLDLSLDNEDGSLYIGEAKVSIHVKDAKADAVYTGSLIVYDEPKERDFDDETREIEIDYEAMTELYSGTWADDKNDLTLFIQPADDVEENGYLFTIQGDTSLITGTCTPQDDYSLAYDEITVNGSSLDSSGYLAVDGAVLIWGHDDAVGEFEYGTLFTRVDE